MPELPHIDRLSFWLGFLASALFWILIRKSQKFWPQLAEFTRSQTERVRNRNIVAVEDHLRREVFRRSQGQHIAWPLFALDEILIEPRLLAPPIHIEPGNNISTEEILASCISYLPDWPELPARFNAPTISLADGLLGGLNIVVIGQPGSGKSVALTNLASQLARRLPQVEQLGNLLPLYLHIADLQITSASVNTPLAPIIRAVSELAPVFVLPQIPAFLSLRFTEGTVILLLDGVDELPPSQLREISSYLKSLLRDFPLIRIVITANPEYADGMVGLGFFPLSIASWTPNQQLQFLEKWDGIWNQHIGDMIQNEQPTEKIDPALLNPWILSGGTNFTPLELTLRVWSAFAGSEIGPQPAEAIESYLLRSTENPKLLPLLGHLALQMAVTTQPILSRHKVESLITETNPGLDLGLEESHNGTSSAKSNSSLESDQIQKSFPACFNNGLLIEHPGDRIRFNHPVIAGFLSSLALESNDAKASLILQQSWPGKMMALRFLIRRDGEEEWAEKILRDSEEPFFTGLFAAVRWMKDGSPNARWKISLLRQLAEIFQRDNLPYGSRLRALAALIQSNDPGAAILFRQNIAHPSQTTRQLAVLGCGAIQDGKSQKEVISLINDPGRLVRYAAIQSLIAIGDQGSVQSLEKILYEGDEEMRRAAAEALARASDEGFAILKGASTNEAILARRAAVFGLAQIQERWAIEILEKMRIEDGQWVVRSAASQSLETREKIDPHVPRILPIPSEAAWLISFASHQGVGISGGTFATEMLIRVLKTGVEEERLAALDYLRLAPDDEVIQSVLHAVYCDTNAVSEAALLTLWYLMLGGATIPSPRNFGYG